MAPARLIVRDTEDGGVLVASRSDVLHPSDRVDGLTCRAEFRVSVRASSCLVVSRALHYRLVSGGFAGSRGRLCGRAGTSAVRLRPAGRFTSPCQGEGRGFESRRPLEKEQVEG